MVKAIKFPDIFNKTSTNIVEDHEATVQNLKCLLGSEQGEFTGDPYFGIKLKRYMYDQNNYILKDILIDEIYNQVAIFMPQLKFDRKDIDIVNSGSTLYANIKARNLLDFTLNTYSLVLLNQEEIR